MKTRTCTNKNCKETNPQPISNFGKRKLSPDGISLWCKSCKRAAYSKWAKTNVGKESIGQAKAKYRKTDKNRAAQRRYQDTEGGKETHREASKRYRAKHQEKYRARKALNHAIEKGRFPSIKTKACTECGKPAQEYHHHKGYEQEHWFDVTPLCAMCHRSVD